VARGAVLLGGLRHIAAEAGLPVRLVEVGASAGLNLRADHFHVAGDAGHYGDPASPVVLAAAWQGAAPPPARVVVIARTGGDLDPIDPATAAGRLQLTAYTWPDQTARLDRLRGALTLAQSVPVDLRRAFAVTLTTWPGGRQRVLGTASAHGAPVTWQPAQGVLAP
jgi:hypothetical protein